MSVRWSLVVAAVFLLITLTLPAHCTVIYVKWDSPSDGPGNDWDHAFHTVTAALSAAGTGQDVWVARGAYSERISLKDGVGLYGGFTGSEDQLIERPSFPRPELDPNETILDGGKAGCAVTSPAGTTSTSRIDGFTIRNGESSKGGGISCLTSSPTIANNKIIGNVSTGEGGGIFCSTNCSPTIYNNIISSNRCTGSTGGGGIYCPEGCSPLISNNLITYNSSSVYGGGIHYQGTAAGSITGNVIVGNSAPKDTAGGGGIACYESAPTIANNLIAANHAERGGGVICVFGAAPLFANNTVVANSSAIRCFRSTPVLLNNIVAFNGAGIFNNESTGPVLQNNCVYQNGEYEYSGIDDTTGLNGNIAEEPRFASVKYGDLHIQPDSPCKDTGAPTSAVGVHDVDGEARVQGTGIDIGADESDGLARTAVPTIIRVKRDGSDTSDGLSWESAVKTLQAGIDRAARRGGEVWVAEGRYIENINLRPFVSLYGGFQGTETERGQRHAKENSTTLDGGQTGSVITARTGFRVSTIDGFTITNGSATAGSGIYCQNSSPTISNNTITNNAYTGSQTSIGGGIACIGNCSPVLSSNLITNNRVGGTYPSGAGMYCDGSPLILNNTIKANGVAFASGSGGGISCTGSPTISNNLIVENTHPSSGAGIYFGTQEGFPISAPKITNNTFVGNNGIAIFCSDYSAGVITNNIVAFNTQGIYRRSTNCNPVIKNNCVFGNTFLNYGGFTTWPSGNTDNISVDPGLVDAAAGDYHLAAASLCINAGLNTAAGLPFVDFEDESRIWEATVDIGADEFWPKPLATGSAKKQGGGSWTLISDAVVTAVFGHSFYVESADRSSGLRVDKLDHGLGAGTVVDVAGRLDTAGDGECHVDAASVTPMGTGSIEPVFLTGRALLSGSFGLQDGLWSLQPQDGTGQPEMMPEHGLSNVGLLIKISGKVTQVDPLKQYFYIDDGSQLRDGTSTGEDENIGVRIAHDGSNYAQGQLLSVTGISSCFKGTDGKLRRLVRVVSSADIQP